MDPDSESEASDGVLDIEYTLESSSFDDDDDDNEEDDYDGEDDENAVADEWLSSAESGSEQLAGDQSGNEQEMPPLEQLATYFDSEGSDAGGGDLTENNFLCSCCYELMIDPTTLVCGHSFCRLCLARNFFSSQHKVACPVCRQEWQGRPQVNILLRDTIQSLFGQKVRERKATLRNDAEALQTLAKFDRVQVFASRTHHQRGVQPFWTGVISSAGIFVVALFVTWLFSAGDADLPHDVGRRLADMSVDDVVSYMSAYLDDISLMAVKDNAIDGKAILTSNFEKQLNITDEGQNSLLDMAVDQLRTRGKMVRSFWEYQSAHPGYTVAVLYGLVDCPRLTLLWLYFIDGHTLDSLMWATYPPGRDFTSVDEYNDWLSVVKPGAVQYVVPAILIPHIVMARYAVLWFSVHYWMVSFFLLTCCGHMVHDWSFWWEVCLRWAGDRLQFRLALRPIRSKLVNLMFVVLMVPFTPSVICNVLFFWKVANWPLLATYRLITNLIHSTRQAAAANPR